MKARWKCSSLLISLSMALIVGCGPQTQEQRVQSAQSDYQKIREQFVSQEGYSFHGRTKLLTGTTANANLVNFSGRVQGKDTIMNVKLSMPEQKRAKTLSLMSKDNRLFAKMEGTANWQPVNQNNLSFQQEFNNWDPKFCFKQMEELGSKITPLNEDLGNDNIRALRVTLDSSKLKSWLTSQLKRQNTSVQVQSVQAPHVARLPFAFTLTDGQMQRRNAGFSIQQADANINDIVSGMDLEAEYTVYYEQSSMLPTKLVMDIRSEYVLNNQRVNEHSEVETYLLSYGQEYNNMPTPTP